MLLVKEEGGVRRAVCTCDNATADQKMAVVKEIRISAKQEHKNQCITFPARAHTCISMNALH